MRGHLRARDRRKQAGSKKMPCKTWQLVVEGERDSTGKRAQHYRSFRGDKADAEKALRAFLSELETGFVGDGNRMTVSVYLQKWLSHIEGRVRSTTAEGYRSMLERRIIPAVGSLKLRDLRPLHIQRIYDETLKSGSHRAGKGRGKPVSPTTVIRLHRVFSSAMKQARKWGLIVANPCDSVETPRQKTHEMRSLDSAEAKKLMDTARGTRLYIPIMMTIAIGMRRGECLALRWSDIDFDLGTVQISRTLNQNGTFFEPKTARSRRTVALPKFAIAALRAHKVAQNVERLAAGEAYGDAGLVFADELGTPWKPAHFSHVFERISAGAQLGHIRFHDLRHTAASLMIEAGVPITTVAQILGHSNTSTTLTVYAHSIKGAEDRAARAMDGIFKGIKSTG